MRAHCVYIWAAVLVVSRKTGTATPEKAIIAPGVKVN